MKLLPIRLKKEVIRFRMSHTWKETCNQFPNLNDETWRQWMLNKEKILNTAELSPEEETALKKQRRQECKKRFREAHPDKVISSLMREKHPLAVCSYHANGNFKAYKSKSKSSFMPLRAFDLWKIAKKQKMICPITGERLTAKNISVDHITPVSKRGSNLPSNIRLVVKEANHMKNHYSDQFFLDMCHKIVANFKPITDYEITPSPRKDDGVMTH
jgi:hypothetical protein